MELYRLSTHFDRLPDREDEWSDIDVIWMVNEASRQFPVFPGDIERWYELTPREQRRAVGAIWSLFTSDEADKFSDFLGDCFEWSVVWTEVNRPLPYDLIEGFP
jgi:hypothetical protein